MQGQHMLRAVCDWTIPSHSSRAAMLSWLWRAIARQEVNGDHAVLEVCSKNKTGVCCLYGWYRNRCRCEYKVHPCFFEALAQPTVIDSRVSFCLQRPLRKIPGSLVEWSLMATTLFWRQPAIVLQAKRKLLFSIVAVDFEVAIDITVNGLHAALMAHSQHGVTLGGKCIWVSTF